MADGKQNKHGAPGNPTPTARAASGLTRPGELYLPGDALPQPDVVEKNTDSVWALWSDMVGGDSAGDADTAPAGDNDFTETMPLGLDDIEPTQLMDLPELDDDDNNKGRKR